MRNNKKSDIFRSGWKVWAGLVVLVMVVGVAVVYVANLLSRDGSSHDSIVHLDDEHDHDHEHDHRHSDEHEDSHFPPRKLRHAWIENQANQQSAPSRPEGLSEDSVYVTLTGDYAQWLLGTPVEIDIPQTDKTYRSVVDRIVPDGFGNTSIYAKPEEEEEEFQQLIVTFGGSQTFAYVSTTVGTYELHGTDETGWLTPTSSMRENIDYTKKDVAETRRDRHANTKYVPRREDQE